MLIPFMMFCAACIGVMLLACAACCMSSIVILRSSPCFSFGSPQPQLRHIMSLLLRVSTNLVWADNLWRCHMKEMRKRDAMVHIGSQKSPTPKTGVGLGFAVFHCLSPLLTYRWTTNRVA